MSSGFPKLRRKSSQQVELRSASRNYSDPKAQLPLLTSATQARIFGYLEGASERAKGYPEAELTRVREQLYELHIQRRHIRGPQVVHYRAWRVGFDAGFLGVAREGSDVGPIHARVARDSC